MIKLLYFFNLVDSLGCAQEEITLFDGVSDVADLLTWLGKRDENIAQPWPMAVNCRSPSIKNLWIRWLQSKRAMKSHFSPTPDKQ
jgi:hypothetical protein